MSYEIEYARQFIRSSKGITPVWLHGCNNVTTLHRGHERRERSWSVFNNMVGTTEEEMLETLSSWKDGFNCHWKRRGGWVTDKGLDRWVRDGCARAATVEEILDVNPFVSIQCFLSVWHPNAQSSIGSLQGAKEEETRITSTEELDAWIDRIAPIMARYDKEHIDYFCFVVYPSEQVRCPKQQIKDNAPVLIRHGRSYLSDIPTHTGNSWCKDIRRAHVFSLTEAKKIKAEHPWGWIGESVFVSAKAKLRPFDAGIQIVGGARDGEYLYSCSGHSISLTTMAKYAKRYADESCAKGALKRLHAHAYDIGSDAHFEVVVFQD